MQLNRLGDLTHIRHYEYSFLLKILSGKSGKLLDIGCLETNLSDYLASLGFDVTAIDIRPTGLALAKFLQMDARIMQFQDKEFDFTVLISTIEHVGFEGDPYSATLLDKDGDIKVMKEVLRVLKDNGTVIISFPYYCLNHQANERSYEKQTLSNLLKGFKIISQEIFTSKDSHTWISEQKVETPRPWGVIILELKKQ